MMNPGWTSIGCRPRIPGKSDSRRAGLDRPEAPQPAWLPVLHSVRGTWHFTALYSNTARAHQLGG
jgi:hypothetical protein